MPLRYRTPIAIAIITIAAAVITAGRRLRLRRAGVEDDPVAAGGDAFILRHPVRLGRHLRQQAIARPGERGQVRIVVLWDDEDVGGRPGIDVTEGEGAVGRQHLGGWYLACQDAAEQTVARRGHRGSIPPQSAQSSQRSRP